MAARPTRWNRFVASLQGEVSAAELEAFRRASAPVLELLEQVEQRRLECTIEGVDPWTVPPATRAAFLCAWNAFVLQTLANDFLEADYRSDPRTPHFVPPATAQQVMRFYEPVEGWVNRAWQAQANPDYRLDVDVPATLPATVPVKPLPPAHLEGLLYAMRSIRDHASAAMEFLPATPPEDPEKQAQLNRIRQIYASAQARARYAEDLCGTGPVPEVRERAGEHARSAIEQFYLLGQLVSNPELAADAPREKRAAAGPVQSATAQVEPVRAAVPRVKRSSRAGAREQPRIAARAERPAGTAAAGTAAFQVVTRHDRFKNLTITEPAETIDFTGRLAAEAHFSLRLSHARGAEGQSVVLRMTVWSHSVYPGAHGGTLTVHADGQNAVLKPLPDYKHNMAGVTGDLTFEEHLGYALPNGLLARLAAARQAGLLFESSRGTVELDDATLARFQAYCRGFHDVLKKLG